MRVAGSRMGLMVAVVGALLALSGCGLGGDDEDAAVAATAATREGWTAQAERYCTDGTQEATALPLPRGSGQLAGDAAARAEIIATVRDGLFTLGRPDEIDEATLAVFFGELEADIEQLAQTSGIDESAGQAAGALGLPACAAFVNAVARTT